VKLMSLSFGDLAFLQLAMNSTVLIGKPVIDLIAARMIAFPLRFGKGGRHGAADNGKRNNESNGLQYGTHGFSLS
jgi:hypothetical protein